MSAVLLAALSAALWGTGDFCGGKASQRADSLHVAVVVALVGVPLVALGAALLSPGAPARADLAWGGAGGLAGFVGLVVFYRALSSGAMAVAAPVTAVASAVTPLAIGLAFERPPGVVALVGAGLAVVAVALVSVAPGRAGRVSTRVVAMALLAGVLFGLSFAALKQAAPGAGLWPLVAARLAGLAGGLAVLARRRALPRLGPLSWRWALVAGGYDTAANATYLLAAQRGLLSVVGPVASLYPAATVVLALVIDREPVRAVQLAGLGLALAALALTAA